MANGLNRHRGLYWLAATLLLLTLPVGIIWCWQCRTHKVRIEIRIEDYKSILHAFSTYYRNDPPFDRKRPLPPLTVLGSDEMPRCSWRLETFLTLPYPAPRGNIKWNSPEYLKLRNGLRPKYFWFADEGANEATVFGIGGPGTAFDQLERISASELPHDLILFADVYESGVHWMQPGDFNIETMPHQPRVPGGLGNSQYDGYIVAFVDGSIWHLRKDTPFSLLFPFLTVSGARSASRSDRLAEYATVMSHAGSPPLSWQYD